MPDPHDSTRSTQEPAPNRAEVGTSTRRPLLKFVLTFLRWGIAVVGIIWIVQQLNWYDHVNLVTPELRVVNAKVINSNGASDANTMTDRYTIIDPVSGAERVVLIDELLSQPDRKYVTVDSGVKQRLLGMQLDLSDPKLPRAKRLLVGNDLQSPGQWVDPSELPGGFSVKTPRPPLEIGLRSMLRGADWRLLALALAIFPLTFILTTYRWQRLLRPLEITLPFMRALSLNMAGFFYSTFLPGSSSGDFIKAYLAAKNTPHKTRAVLSVFIDRVLGLLALVMLGGTMATVQYLRSGDTSSPTARACLQVAIGSVAICMAMALGVAVINSSRLRAILGLSAIIKRLPMQKQLEHVRDVGRVFRSNPWLIFWSLLITVPVHLTVVGSAWLAGEAFGLPISPAFYLVAVPVLVLVGAVPLTPGGVGVMEFFAVVLTATQGATVSEALALAMSIRLTQMSWNMVGGLFVLRGGFTAPPNESQMQQEMEAGDIDAVNDRDTKV